MLTEPERASLLTSWNDTAADYPRYCIHQLFEAQAERTPEAVAVVFEGDRLTYRERWASLGRKILNSFIRPCPPPCPPYAASS